MARTGGGGHPQQQQQQYSFPNAGKQAMYGPLSAVVDDELVSVGG
jgi:hypothetical protein